jgi:hypothetical protein
MVMRKVGSHPLHGRLHERIIDDSASIMPAMSKVKGGVSFNPVSDRRFVPMSLSSNELIVFEGQQLVTNCDKFIQSLWKYFIERRK